MKCQLITAPTIEPVTLAEMKTQLGIDSGTMASDSTMYKSLPSGSYPIDYELMTLDVAPVTPWAVDDIITGQTSSKTCTIVTVLTTKTFIVKSRSGTFTLGEIVGVTGVAGKLADQGATKPTFVTTYNFGYMALGTGINVLGHTSVVYLNPVDNGASGTMNAKIQEADVLAGPYTDWSTGTFALVTEANDTTIQEKQYTGSKQYIRTVAKTLVAACEFGTSIVVWEPNVTDDDYLTDLIETARRDVENDTSRKLITQTWDYCPKSWPDDDKIKLPFGNLQSVTSVIWKDTDGDETILTKDTDYVVVTNSNQCGFVGLLYQGSWPSGTLYPHNPITIRFICGYGDNASDVPVTARQAIRARATNLYVNRGDDVVGQQVTYDKTYNRLVNNIGKLHDMDFDF